MQVYCDMDMVLVHQTGRERFDLMPWNPGGRELWAFLKARCSPILLTQVRGDRFGLTAQEKLAWIDRELGMVPVIFTPDSRGKGPFARPGDLLIDDAVSHCEAWKKNGGTAIQHRTAEITLHELRRLL